MATIRSHVRTNVWSYDKGRLREPCRWAAATGLDIRLRKSQRVAHLGRKHGFAQRLLVLLQNLHLLFGGAKRQEAAHEGWLFCPMRDTRDLSPGPQQRHSTVDRNYHGGPALPGLESAVPAAGPRARASGLGLDMPLAILQAERLHAALLRVAPSGRDGGRGKSAGRRFSEIEELHGPAAVACKMQSSGAQTSSGASLVGSAALGTARRPP